MKKPFLLILSISLALAIVGFLVDGDQPEPGTYNPVLDLAGMTVLLFTLISGAYVAVRAMRQKSTGA